MKATAKQVPIDDIVLHPDSTDLLISLAKTADAIYSFMLNLRDNEKDDKLQARIALAFTDLTNSIITAVITDAEETIEWQKSILTEKEKNNEQ